MKYVVYLILFFACGFLFLPRTGTTEIRNLPLLLFILSLILICILFRFFKCVLLVAKTKKHLKRIGVQRTKTKFFPWTSRFHGHYSITFPHDGEIAQIVLLSRKRKYQRYHFDSVNRLEFYRANRVIFGSTKIRGGTISNLVEVKQVGNQGIRWDDTATVRAVLFDRLPDDVTDSKRKESLAAGDGICQSETLLLDWPSFLKHFPTTK